MLGTSFGSGGGSVGGSGHLARARPPLFLPLRAAASAALAAAAPVTVPLGPLPGFASPRVSVNVSVASLPFADLRWERVLLFSLWCKGCPNQGVCVIALKWLPGAPQERPFSLANYSPLLFLAAALVSLSLSLPPKVGRGTPLLPALPLAPRLRRGRRPGRPRSSSSSRHRSSRSRSRGHNYRRCRCRCRCVGPRWRRSLPGGSGGVRARGPGGGPSRRARSRGRRLRRAGKRLGTRSRRSTRGTSFFNFA